jgi:hypothetical protein
VAVSAAKSCSRCRWLRLLSSRRAVVAVAALKQAIAIYSEEIMI